MVRGVGDRQLRGGLEAGEEERPRGCCTHEEEQKRQGFLILESKRAAGGFTILVPMLLTSKILVQNSSA